MNLPRRCGVYIEEVLVLGLIFSFAAADVASTLQRPFQEWTLEEAIQVLNDSPWARQVTLTEVIDEVGSGVRGEKEILKTFYVRLLSAPPVRQALARVEQINHGFDQMSGLEREEFLESLRPGLEMPMRRFIVVTVSFRSNDSEQENEIQRYFQTQTADTLANQVYLSSSRVARLRLRGYFAPAGDGLGARFVFPRYLDGRPVFAGSSDTLLFQMELPDLDTPVNVAFPLANMQVDGELLL